MRVGVTDAAVPGLADPVLPEGPDEGRKVCKMAKRDLDSDREVLQTARLDGPRRVIRQGVLDPGLLGAGEHGAAMLAERAGMGQRVELTPDAAED